MILCGPVDGHAIYGYTMVYRETHDEVRFWILPEGIGCLFVPSSEDMIPYWDFNVSELSSGEPKDASAAAITALCFIGTFHLYK